MPKKLISFFICLIFMGGCASTQSTGKKKDTQVRAYKQDKVRVDQVVQGSLGNWQNSPDVVDDPNRKSTRKVYVVEFSKDADPLPEDAFDVEEFKRQPLRESKDDEMYMEDYPPVQNFGPSSTSSTTSSTSSGSDSTRPKFTFPNFDDDDDFVDVGAESTVTTPVTTTQATSFVDYKVKKDDTLQKISKQFYGGYSKWTRIYEANKKIIKDPNFIKPGITLKIPME